MKKIILILIVVILSKYETHAESFNASVSLSQVSNLQKIDSPKLYFGCFLEFLNDFINGQNGLWAQELYNRGFDELETNSIPSKWSVGEKNEISSIVAELGGYNENGVYGIQFKSNQSGLTSIKQSIYLESSVGSDFYIYLKNLSPNSSVFVLKIKAQNDSQVLFEKKIEINNTEWEKYSIDIPALLKSNNVIVEVGLVDDGEIEIDEVSLMPSNNVNGVRKEFFDMFKEWSPGIIRYPGGYFADMDIAHFEYSIGSIDKRKSPLKSWENHYQRMDFGLNEFISFCRAVNAEPHLVVNLLNGTAQEAANFVEYCNGSSLSTYGAKRAKDGFVEPHNVKYWEIGNEQWNNLAWMLPRYLQYQEAMNKIDSKLYYIIDGDVWQGKSYFDACFKATAEKCHNYGWHYAFNALPKSNEYDEKERYKIAIAGIDEMNRHIVEIESWLIADNYFPTAKQSITENFINYNVQPGWIDTNYMNASLEAGLIEAGLLMNFLNSPKTFELYEKTFGLGHIRIGENSSNKRVFYPTVVQNSLSFIRNNSGNYSHQLIVNSPKYNTELLDGMFQLWDIPKIHCSFTSDSLHNYLYLMNKDYQDDAIIQLDSTLNDYFQESEIYELASESIRDHNSPDNPNIINFKKISPVNPLLLKPHSVRLLVSKKNSSVETNMDNIAILVEKPKILIYNISEQCSIEIYDILGKKVLHQSFDSVSEKINIDFSGQNSGVYIVRISVNGKIITKKIAY